MSLTLFPCEIFHREFDAKLLIAFEMASKFGTSSLIGYDKYFQALIPHLPASTLMEKSCSTIMWNGRISPVKNNGGAILVTDEEGFNNLTTANRYTFVNRLDRLAAKSIDIYSCWGKVDYEFWHSIPELHSKLSIMGNSRSDLLGKIGRQYFSKDIKGLNAIFGRFVLVSDNFCVERRGGNHFLPVFNVSKDNQRYAQNELEQGLRSQARRRNFFAELVENTARDLPEVQFIIRPHPTSDSRWWTNRFADLRNIHVIYHKSVEPWILSCCALISMGCTTALQASVGNVPVIEIEDPNLELDKGQNRGFSHLFTDLTVQTSEELKLAVLNAFHGRVRTLDSKRDLLCKYWHGSDTSLSYLNFGKTLHEISPKPSDSSYTGLLQRAYYFYKKQPLFIDDTKWPSISFSEVKNKFLTLNSVLMPPKELFMHKVAKHLFYIGRK